MRGNGVDEQNGARVGISTAFEGDDNAIAHTALSAQRGFQILGINIQSRRRNDHILLAPTETQVAFRIQFAKIARAQPTFLTGRLQCSRLPVTTGNVFAADEDFSVLSKTKLASGKDLPNRTFSGAEGMIEADQGSGFCHAVNLGHRIAHASEALLDLVRKRRTA